MNDKEFFNNWNEEKQRIDTEDLMDEIIPKEGEVWVCAIGKNVGREQNGSPGNFSRPVLIIKKFNRKMFWGVPLTTKQKDLDHYFNFTDPFGEKVALITAQIRLLSTKRLKRILYKMPLVELKTTKILLVKHVVDTT